MKSLLLIGCGGHARSLIDLIESTGQWRIHGLVGLPEQVGSSVLGYRVIASGADLPSLRDSCRAAVLAIGQLPDPAPRQRLAAQLEQLGFHCPVLISSHAVVSRHAQLGPGTTVGHGVIVNAAAVVGAYCILNSRALIEHDVQIGDHCHISTGALVNGGVRVGSGSFIGSGAMLREGLELPGQTVIGAGKRVMGWPLRDER
jgi:sugar O-acyltransferase (sialic acid O-acetyltransferase NeuD family)